MAGSNWTHGLAAAALGLGLAASAHADNRIVNGVNSQDFPTTGALLYSGGGTISTANASVQCTGTLIGCRTFLTAAHCVYDDTGSSHYWVYLQNSGLHTVSSVTYNPSYDPNTSGRDVAIVKLSSAVTGIDPTTINTSHNLNSLGTGLGGIITGFGRTGGGSDYGVKRTGAVVTADCNTVATGGEGNDKLVCWNYDAAVGAPGADSNTCNGDSGGPLFMTFSNSTEVVGVTSAGTATNCGVGDHSWDSSVYYNSTWITGQIGADSTAACGSIPAVGDPTVTVTKNSGALSAGNTSNSFEVSLAGSPQLLRFTLNGTDNGSFNPDFFVKQGSGASPSSYDCKADGATVFGACEFLNPAAGTWSVHVARSTGSGEYQITTSIFGGASAACGDNSTNGSEQCDGTDDAACPGACLGDCTCPQACTSGPLYGLSILSDPQRFSYKAELHDGSGALSTLNPRDDAFGLSITDGSGLVDVSIPAGDPGWIKADPVRRKFSWKGDGTYDGLTGVKMVYKNTVDTPYWIVSVRGKGVTGAGTLDVQQVLDFALGIDGTCHLESW